MIWKADHPNYEKDDDQPTTNVSVPEWGEPWWSVDHVSIFIES